MKAYLSLLKPYLFSWITAFIIAVILCGASFSVMRGKQTVRLAKQSITYERLPAWAPKAKPKTATPGGLRIASSSPLPALSSYAFPLKNTAPIKHDGLQTASKIAIILTHVGGIKENLEAIHTQLPPEITLAFYGPASRVAGDAAQAHAKGHECLMMLPLEPLQYPDQDAGAYTLLTGLKPEENIKRLLWHIEKLDTLMGVTTLLGSRFMACEADLIPLVQALKKQHLAFIDLGSTPRTRIERLCKHYRMPCLKNARHLDKTQTVEEINTAFTQLEAEAVQQGWAVGYGMVTPFMVEKLKTWSATLATRSLQLVPLSVILKGMQPSEEYPPQGESLQEDFQRQDTHEAS